MNDNETIPVPTSLIKAAINALELNDISELSGQDAKFCHDTLKKLIELLNASKSSHSPAARTRMLALLDTYGPDFHKKLPLYKTAKLNDQWVRLVSVNLDALTAVVEHCDTGMNTVYINELTDFCL